MNEILEFCLKNITRCACSPTTYKTLSVITDQRAKMCAKVANVASPLTMHIHNSTNVEQFIGTPDNAVCIVTQQRLHNKYGVQLKYDNVHVCVHPDVAEIMYHYFCIRHFPRYMCGRVREWLQMQPWFAGYIDAKAQKITRAHWEPRMQREFNTSMAYLESFVNRSAQKRRTLIQ
jgi:hypothetical protein